MAFAPDATGTGGTPKASAGVNSAQIVLQGQYANAGCRAVQDASGGLQLVASNTQADQAMQGAAVRPTC